MDEMEEVISRFSWVPYPVTITSDNEVISTFKVTSITDCVPTTISEDEKPIELNTNTDSGEGAVIENLPSLSLTVPSVVPLTRIFTPGKPCPSSAETIFPDTMRSCAQTDPVQNNASKNPIGILRRFFLKFDRVLCII
jgi:hypothetical protein